MIHRFSAILPRIRPQTAGRVLLPTLLLVVLSGCSHVYPVKVDAMRTDEVAPRRTYHIVAADPGAAASEPTFAEARIMVARVLDDHGFLPASRPEWADMIVELDLQISRKRFISVTDPTARDHAATAVFLPDRGADTAAGTSGIQAPPSTLKRVVAMWEKQLSLVARDNVAPVPSNTGRGAELWRVAVSLQDDSPTLEGLVPVLTSALVDSIDRETPTTMKYISAAAVRTGRAPGTY